MLRSHSSIHAMNIPMRNTGIFLNSLSPAKKLKEVRVMYGMNPPEGCIVARAGVGSLAMVVE